MAVAKRDNCRRLCTFCPWGLCFRRKKCEDLIKGTREEEDELKLERRLLHLPSFLDTRNEQTKIQSCKCASAAYCHHNFPNFLRGPKWVILRHPLLLSSISQTYQWVRLFQRRTHKCKSLADHAKQPVHWYINRHHHHGDFYALLR